MEGAEEEEEEEEDSPGNSPDIPEVDLEVCPNMDREQCGRPGLGQRPGLGPGLGLGLGLEPGASRSTFLLDTPSPLSSDGVFTTTSFSTKPESNFSSG